MAPITQIVQQGEHRLKVWFADGALCPEVPLNRLPGVRIVERQPGILHVAYQGAADPIVKWLGQFPVDRITTPQTSLEEAFMQYYRQRPPANGTTGHDSKGPRP